LLVAQVASHRNAAQSAHGLAVDFRRRADGGQHSARHTHDLQDLRDPIQGLEVHQHGAGGIGNVGHMRAAVRAAGQVPDDPGIDITKQDFALLSLGAHTCHVVQDPFNLGSREIGCQRQADFGAEAILPAVFGELIAALIGAGILPYDCIVDRPASSFLPYYGGLALVGDAHCGNIRRIDIGLFQSARDHFLGAFPDLQCIVLDPTRLGINLFVFFLFDRHHFPVMIENHKTSAGGTLIYCCCVLSHFLPPDMK